MSEKAKKKDQKKCGVCGDNALGSNFNAITCESCKAFFRRNALKTKEFKCPFEDNCKIEVVTRRFCQRCRLRKCFTIGMKKEWIMSEEEKKAKREKIESNRKRKGTRQVSMHVQELTYIKTEVIDDGQTVLSPLSTMSPLTPQTPGSVGITADLPKSNVFAHQPLTPSDCEYSPSPKVLILESASNSMQDGKLSDVSSQHDGSSMSDIYEMNNESETECAIAAVSQTVADKTALRSSEDHKSTSFSLRDHTPHLQVLKGKMHDMLTSPDHISQSAYAKAIEIEFTELPIRTTLLNSKELNTLEKSKLEELVYANEILNMPLNCDVTDPSLIDVVNMTDHAIRRLITMSKKLSCFKNLCQEDQIALLKGGCTELMILRSVMSYDPERECWKGPNGPKVMSIKVEVLKEAKGNLYEEHKRFITSFHPQWRSDENIMLLLCGITLFTPERPNTIHKESIKVEQDTYYYLLYRYLNSIYSSCESKTIYLKLIHKIEELHILNENHVRVYLDVNPKEVEPLLIEIFDLKN